MICLGIMSMDRWVLMHLGLSRPLVRLIESNIFAQACWSWSRFLRRFRSDLTGSLSKVKSELSPTSRIGIQVSETEIDFQYYVKIILIFHQSWAPKETKKCNSEPPNCEIWQVLSFRKTNTSFDASGGEGGKSVIPWTSM